MGKLVRFGKRSRLIPAQSPAGGEAQVLIFTGVRYERENNSQHTKTPSGQKRNRKRG